MIDWTNLHDKISDHFTVKEALWLPQWNRLANEQDGLDDEVKANLVELFKKMDVVRNYFGKPINVHVTYRPEAYNQLVKGAKNSAHKVGKACDFDVVGMDCDKAREMLETCLEQWDMRMENNGPGAPWLHLDTAPVINTRYFKP